MKEQELFPPVVEWQQVRTSILKNEKAVYGYSPRPDSVSIGIHAKWDWRDQTFVAHAREVRIQYRKDLTEMYHLAQKMYADGNDDETVARTISDFRNRERIHAYVDTPDMLSQFLDNNQKRYGTANGISADDAYKKYGSWKVVLEKSLSINLGMDVCCGLCEIKEGEKTLP